MSLDKLALKPKTTPTIWGCREEQFKFPGVLTDIEMTHISQNAYVHNLYYSFWGEIK